MNRSRKNATANAILCAEKEEGHYRLLVCRVPRDSLVRRVRSELWLPVLFVSACSEARNVKRGCGLLTRTSPSIRIRVVRTTYIAPRSVALRLLIFSPFQPQDSSHTQQSRANHS